MPLFRRQKKTEPAEKRLPAVVIERQNTTLPENATDEMVIAMWLKQRPKNTQTAYKQDIKDLDAFTNHTPLQQLNLLQLQNFADSLNEQEPATVARKMSAIKSLLTFCHKAGYTQFNVGAAVRLPRIESKLAERIMSEASLQKILALETDQRNHAMLRLMYNTGIRVSELVALTWNDLQQRDDLQAQGSAAQIRAYGKGGKERYILISAETYQELLNIRENALDFAPIFQSRIKTKGGSLTRGQVNKIVEAAAIRANVATFEATNKKGQIVTRSRVSPHWFRHAHATHAIERGSPLPVVRDTLGHASIAVTNKYSHARPGSSSGTYLAV